MNKKGKIPLKMIPGINERQLKAMMRQMGMSQEDISAIKVTIETTEKKIIFENPLVTKISMQGKETFQIIGDYKIEETEPEIKITESDIKMVSDQARVSEKEAKEALIETKGDIAEAIIKLTENNKTEK